MSVSCYSWFGVAKGRSRECGNILIVQVSRVSSQFIRHSLHSWRQFILDKSLGLPENRKPSFSADSCIGCGFEDFGISVLT
jgi:hypothetical protein